MITFASSHVRVVQASCIPSSSPTVSFTYRGSFSIGNGLADWDPDVARNVVRWIKWPEEPLLPVTEMAEEDRRSEEAVPEKAVAFGGGPDSDKNSPPTSSQSFKGG